MTDASDRIYTLTGACPRCGAPIYAVTPRENMENLECVNAPPGVHYTCTCRALMPGGWIAGDDDTGDETLEAADRKTLARRREKAPESPSVERAD